MRAAAIALLGLVLVAPGEWTHRLGRSVHYRPIVAVELGDPHSPRKILVVGCIHGNERAGIAIARAIERMKAPGDVDLWVVERLNPDGAAGDTRQNAHGVDLNRNFPFHWRALSGYFYSGPRPLSEPESRIAYRLILRLRPVISIWFHQHLRAVDDSGGSHAIEARYAALVGLPLRRLAVEPGSVTAWENHRLPRNTAFVVELPPGQLSPSAARRYAAAVMRIAR